jgi:hypothetical protein
MDKLENESWEEYAFRHELFEIIYADKDKQIIDYINLPNPDKYCYPVYTICSTFRGFIWEKIKNIKYKYSSMRPHDCTYQGFSYFGLSLLSKEDNELQKKLYTLYHFWVPKEHAIFDVRALKKYNRSVNTKEYFQDKKIKEHIHNEKIKESKKENIELYQKYFKNKEIRLKIIELEQKISNLHSELIK